MDNFKKVAYIILTIALFVVTCQSVSYSAQISKRVNYNAEISPFDKIDKKLSFPENHDPFYLQLTFLLSPGTVTADFTGEVIFNQDNETITLRGSASRFSTEGGINFTGTIEMDFILPVNFYTLLFASPAIGVAFGVVDLVFDLPEIAVPVDGTATAFDFGPHWRNSKAFNSFLLDGKSVQIKAGVRDILAKKLSAIDLAGIIVTATTGIPPPMVDIAEDVIKIGLGDSRISLNAGLTSNLKLSGKEIIVNGQKVTKEGQSISAPGLNLSQSSYAVDSTYVEKFTSTLDLDFSADIELAFNPLGIEMWAYDEPFAELLINVIPERERNMVFNTTPNPIRFPIQETPTNQAPQTVGSIDVPSLTVGGSTATVDVSSYFSDPNNDNLTYSVTSDNTGVATVAVSGSRITITPSGQGSARLTVTARDPSGSAATQTANVTVQTASSCTYTLSQRSQDVLAAGGSLQVGVTTTSGCDWTASTSSDFLSVSPSSGTGSGTVRVSVHQNTRTRSRSGTVRIAGRTFTVNQERERTIASQDLSKGDTVIVQNTLHLGLNIRSGAGTDHAKIGGVSNGATGTVTDGPRNANGFKWWKVDWDNNAPTGWSVEAIDEELLLLRRPPDLAITAFDVSDSTVDPGEEITLSLTVRNGGYNRSETTDLYYYHTSTKALLSSDDLTLVGTDSVGGLNPSRSSDESIRVKAPLDHGTYYYAAALIPTADDSNIANNIAPAKERVRVRKTTFPDLVVESPSVSDNTLAPGETFTLSATVRNKGSGESRSTKLRYYRSSGSTISRNDTQVDTDGVSSLDPDGTDDESETLTAPSEPGVYYYGACVDRVRDETDRGNNCSDGVRVTVRSPDLAVETVQVSRNTVGMAESFTLSATVQNRGTGPSASTTLRYYLSADSTISTDDTEIGTDSVGALSGKGTSDQSETVTAQSEVGVYYYGACVDTVTSESSVNNNCSSGISVTVALNQAPVAVDDTASVTEGRTARIDVLANDTDAEGNPLTISLVAQPTNGTATMNTDQSFSYTHNGSKTTRDSFTYKANDGTADSNIATVTITVTPLRVAKTISIPDANLRRVVEAALDKSSGATISDVDMETLIGISAPNKNISTLTGLQHATNLKRLDLGYATVGSQLRNSNSVSDISHLAGLTNLTLLNLGGNNISDIAGLRRLTDLIALVLSDNSISNISHLAGLINLKYVSLVNNSISDLSPLTANTGLGRDDRVDVQQNPLNNNSINTTIPTLQSRGVTVEFSSRTPTTLLKISGDNQQGAPGEALTNPFIVEVRDAANSGILGVGVTFSVTAGGGSLSTQNATTDTNGRASTTLTLGSNTGTNTVEASVTGISSSVSFTATAQASANHAPLAVGTISEQTVTAGGSAATVNVSAHFSDPDNDNLTYTANSDNTASATVSVSGAVVTISPKTAGSATVTVTASDGTLTATQDIAVTVEAATTTTPVRDAVNIPDAALRTKIEEALNKQAGDPITSAELKTLTRLEATDANISDLAGIEAATNLTTLLLRGNSISNLSPLSGLTKLTELQLFRNLVSDLSPLAGLTNLTDLKAGNNSISNLSPLSGLTKLTYLGLHNNSISNLSPLVANTGLGSGDTVLVTGNPLSQTSIQTHIPTLEGRGVRVDFTASANQAPQAIGTIPAQTLTVGGSAADVDISANFRDIDTATLTYTATSDGTAVATVSVSGAVVTITPESAGSATVTVTASDGTSTATQDIAVEVEAAPHVPHTLEKISGDNQEGPPDEALLSPFIVEVRDTENRRLEGIDVTFTVTEGGGSLSETTITSETTVTTDANGQASTTLTLGPKPGTNTVEAAATGVSPPVSFIATAQELPNQAPEPIGTIQAEIFVEADSAAEVDVTANFRDPNNDTLTYTATSDDTAVATVTVSGAVVTITPQSEGSATVTVTASDGTSTATQDIVVEVEAAPRVAQTLEKISGDNQQGSPGEALLSPFIVEVRDTENRGLEGIDVTFAVTAGGGSLSETTVTTDADGQASSILTLGNNEGTNTVRVTAEGISETVTFEAVGANEINIPDPNLRAKIESALRKRAGDPITAAEMATLTRLSARFSNISNLAGLKFAIHLTSLDLEGNRLTVLPTGVFEGLSRVTVLDLNRNPLETIKSGAFNGLSSLRQLILDFHPLRTIESGAFNGLNRLTKLDLEGNRITTLPTGVFEGLPRVTNLNLNRNPLTTIRADAFKGLDSLQTLILDFHQLTTIESGAFNGLNRLTRLDLEGNRITTLPAGVFVGLNSLTSLNLNRNPGTPFTLTLQLVRTDTTDPAAPGPATVVVQLAQGAPFEMTINLSVEGGTLSTTTATIERGKIQSDPITLTQSGRAPATVSMGAAPRVTGRYDGIRMAVGRPLSTGAIPPHALEIISGDNQEGPSGVPLENPFVVEVQDAANRGLEGVDVTFAIIAGGGTLSETTVTTDADGQAESWLTLGSQPGTNTVEVSVEGLAQTVTFNALAKSLIFDLSMPAGINLIHVPLKVTRVDGVPHTIESIADLYDALGGAATVNFLITHDPNTQDFLSYFGVSDRGTFADKGLTDDAGIIASMKAPVSVRLQGNALGTNGRSTLSLNQGLNLVGLPLRDPRIDRVSDLLALEGIGGNVPVVILTENDEFKVVGQPGDPSNIPISGGQSFILTAQRTATVGISGDGWTNVSGGVAAPLVRGVDLTGTRATDNTPVLALRGSIVDELTGANRTGFRAIVKNLSAPRDSTMGSAVATATGAEGTGYQLTVLDVETGRAATVGDLLQISAQSPDPLIGVQPVRYTVTLEDVRRSWIQLPTLIAYEIPAETELLRNYPNPFNPETWIPYRLAEDAVVTLTIYDLSGQVVRTLDIGHQIAATYEERSKAIRWDGRNQVGDPVASGVYFYYLSAGDYSATRKMVILK